MFSNVSTTVLSLSLKGQAGVVPSQNCWAQKLSQQLGLSPLVAQVLADRAHSLEEAEAFLRPSLKNHLPDPAVLPDIQKAIDLLIHAIQSKRPMAIWGDYDVDGATSSALWIRFLKSLGFEPKVHIPNRFREGYGPNSQGLKALADQGVQVVIIVDCGTTAFEPLETAQSLGLDVVVIDHHMPEARLPPCSALINPKRCDTSSEVEPFRSLAAVGLSFFVIMALNRALRKNGYYDAKNPEVPLLPLLDIVALGTVCDVMPLLGINRVLVSSGLKVMARRTNLGVRTLLDVSGIREIPTTYHLGFVLGPRINAGGRIDESDLGTRLLVTEDPNEAFQIATQLDTLNRERQSIEKTLEQQAIAQAESQKDAPILVVAGPEWHQGVIGIVASRLKDRFHKATFVIGWDPDGETGRGSARSINGLDIGSLIHEAQHKGLILGGGGHPMAGGLSLKRSHYESFIQFVQKRVPTLQPHPPKPRIHLTAPLTFQALTDDFLQQLQMLAPFGMGNPQPVILFHGLMLQSVACVGTHHLRLTLMQLDGKRIQAMAFRAVGKPLGDFLLNRPQSTFKAAAIVQKNTYNGNIQLILEDIWT